MRAANGTAAETVVGNHKPWASGRWWVAPLLFALVVVLPTGPVGAAIGTPTSIGTGTSTTTGATLAFNASANVSVGNTVIVTFTMLGSSGTPVTCADTKLNTYIKDADSVSAGMRTVIFSSTITTAITTTPTTTITITHPSVQYKLAAAIQVSGLSTLGRFDKSNTSTGSSVTPSATLASATTTAAELLIGSFGIDDRNTTFGAGTGYTAFGVHNTGTNPGITHAAEYRIVSSTSAYSASGTTQNAAWSAGIAAYTACGSGVVDTGEQCDQGAANGTAGSCCSATCTFVAAATTCRASAGQCDVAETCTGSSATCPTDAFRSGATICTGASQAGACDNDAADHCLGTANTCVDVFQAPTLTCRASGGQCDVAETCTGSSGACPANAFRSGATICTGASQAGACDNDAADHCSGTANTCVDVFQANTLTCRASAGQCDVAETCTGSSGACPANAFQSEIGRAHV